MLALSFGGLLAACATNEPPADSASRASAVETSATVEAVNAERREIMLRTSDGRFLTVEAGPEVRNFDQIETGDVVRALVVESVAVSMAGPDSSGETEIVTAAERAPEGARPAGAAASELTTTVTLVSYDPATAVATFTTPSGATHSVVVDPAMRDFASRRQPGDRIDVRYTTAVAIAVEEVQG